MQVHTYILGDMMTYGAQKEIEFVENALTKAGLSFYSARLNKDINDKGSADNTNLAERIVAADTEAMLKASLLIVVNPGVSIGTTVEIGQMLEFNRQARLQGLPEKDVIVVSSDIRRAYNGADEVGDRRSYSINAYLYGAILELTHGKGIYSLDELPEALKQYRQQQPPVLF